MQIMLHFIAVRFLILTQDPRILYKMLYLYKFIKCNVNPSDFVISLGPLHK
jgi:hypothetical protein